MKYLINYVEEGHSKALEKYGGFYAFSDKQFEEQKKEDIKYASLGMGLICPSDNAKELIAELNRVVKEGITQDIEENKKEGIIARELENHEAYYTGDITSTIDALSGYGFTEEEIREVYKERGRDREI